MRIVSLQPSVTLTLHALGKLDSLCAITKYCLEALPELAAYNLPLLHDSWTAKTEEILAARPDLVIASVPYQMESLTAILKSGLPVLALAPHNLGDISNDIRLIASVTGASGQAETIIQAMEQEIAAMQAKVAGTIRKRVYCEEWGKPMIHSQAWVAELVEAAGGTFVGAPGTHTTAEEIEAANPDVLLFAWCGAGNRVPLAKVIEQRGWGRLKATQNGSTYCVPDRFFNTPAPVLIDGMRCIAAAIHPHLFPSHAEMVQLISDSHMALTPNHADSTL